jgi:FkbM family methyltransferase
MSKAAATSREAIKAMLPQNLLLRLRVWKDLRREPELKLARCICSRSELSMDVGANRGTYAYLFSKYSDHVLAIEPHPLMAERLKQSLPKSIEVLNFAASDRDGDCTFHIPVQAGKDVDSRCSLEADVNKEFVTRTISVKRRRLDNFPIGRSSVGVVKVDVEGHELNALQGLAGVFERFKPTVIVESEARHHTGAPENVFQFLLSFGYEGYFIHRGTLRGIEEFSTSVFQAQTTVLLVGEKPLDYVNNFIFVHPSRVAVLDRVMQIFPTPAIVSAFVPSSCDNTTGANDRMGMEPA